MSPCEEEEARKVTEKERTRQWHLAKDPLCTEMQLELEWRIQRYIQFRDEGRIH